MSRVYKYTFPFTGRPIKIVAGDVRHVAVQNPEDRLPTIWVEHDDHTISQINGGGEAPEFIYQLIGTGHAFDPTDLEFVGSAVCANGYLVWHVYRTKLPADV